MPKKNVTQKMDRLQIFEKRWFGDLRNGSPRFLSRKLGKSCKILMHQEAAHQCF